MLDTICNSRSKLETTASHKCSLDFSVCLAGKLLKHFPQELNGKSLPFERGKRIILLHVHVGIYRRDTSAVDSGNFDHKLFNRLYTGKTGHCQNSLRTKIPHLPCA